MPSLRSDWRPRSSLKPGGLACPAMLALGLIGGAGLVTSASTLVRASDGAGILEFLRTEGTTGETAPVEPARRAWRFSPPAGQAVAHRVARPRITIERSARRRAPKPPVAAQVAAQIPAGPRPGPHLGARTVCVRLCDGYGFPIAPLRARADLSVHEAACKAACPGAETRLFASGPSGGDNGLAEAVAADGARYAALKTAFAYQSRRVADCSCQGRDHVAARLAVALDQTLRRGDVIAGADGPRIFAGGARTPFPPGSFQAFKRTSALASLAKKQVDAAFGISRREAELKAERAAFKAGARKPAVQVASDSRGANLLRASDADSSFALVRVIVPAPYR